MKWSILISSVPERVLKLDSLMSYLEASIFQAGAKGAVEVLSFMDNRTRSIGMKRQGLLDMARGEYVSFVDDDDWLLNDYVERIFDSMRRHSKPDVFVFPSTCVLMGLDIRVEHSIRYENEAAQLRTFTRKPWHIHPIRSVLAKSSRFTDRMYGEDADWLAPLWPQMKVEYKVSNEPLYLYQGSQDGLE